MHKPHLNSDCEYLNRTYGAPGRIAFAPSASGSPVASIANQYGSVEISLFGGQTLQYRPTGHFPLFFLPEKVDFTGGKDVHGGIPVCWPWFGRCGEPGSRSHGFVRRFPWAVRSASYSDEMTEIVIGISDTPETRKLWDFAFDLELKISVSMKLTLSLTAVNTDSRPLLITEGFHPYFRVSGRSQVEVRGVDGLKYWFAMEKQGKDSVWTGSVVPGDRPLDHVFWLPESKPQHEFALIDPAMKRAVAIVSRGNAKLVVWTPDKIAEGDLDGLTAGDQPKFVCVEPASLMRDEAYTIEPGKSHCLMMAIQANLG